MNLKSYVPEGYVSLKRLAEHMNVSSQTIRLWLKRKLIVEPTVKTARQTLWRTSDLPVIEEAIKNYVLNGAK